MEKANKYCFKCGAKVTMNSRFCANCGASLSHENKTKVDKTVSKIKSTSTDFGTLLLLIGVVLIIGSVIALLMKGPMEAEGRHRIWAIGGIIYIIFVSTGFIDYSFVIGLVCVVVGFILISAGNKE